MAKSGNSGFFQPMTLDVDEKILDRNLMIVSSEAEEGFGSLFPSMSTAQDRNRENVSLLPEPNYPSVQVTPEPGMCVKTTNVAGGKVFINVCKIQEIPPAPPLSEEKLQDIILSEDYTANYRVPMSLGAPREEKDKSGNPCLVCDVAVNSVWYSDTMVNSLTFTTFVVNLAMEGLCDKYGDQVNLDRQNWIILKNKKYTGELQRHHIQQRPGLSKIQELDGGATSRSGARNPLVVEMDDEVKPKERKKRPDFTLHKDNRANVFSAEVKLPGIVSGRDLFLDVGEDRLILNSGMYELDIFVPVKLDGARTKAKFVKDKHVLSVETPIIL